MRTCEWCGGSLGVLQRAGARFCAPKCRAAANRGMIPLEMRQLDRWVTYSAKKVPLQLDGSAASSTDSSTWTSYPRVRALRRKGFVLGEGIACLDLDHCLVDGVPTLWAKKVLRQCPETYIEISPSGDGLHIWGHGSIEPGRRVPYAGGTVEAYSTGRYITVTSKRWGKCPSKLGDLTPFLNLIASL